MDSGVVSGASGVISVAEFESLAGPSETADGAGVLGGSRADELEMRDAGFIALAEPSAAETADGAGVLGVYRADELEISDAAFVALAGPTASETGDGLGAQAGSGSGGSVCDGRGSEGDAATVLESGDEVEGGASGGLASLPVAFSLGELVLAKQAIGVREDLATVVSVEVGGYIVRWASSLKTSSLLPPEFLAPLPLGRTARRPPASPQALSWSHVKGSKKGQGGGSRAVKPTHTHPRSTGTTTSSKEALIMSKVVSVSATPALPSPTPPSAAAPVATGRRKRPRPEEPPLEKDKIIEEVNGLDDEGQMRINELLRKRGLLPDFSEGVVELCIRDFDDALLREIMVELRNIKSTSASVALAAGLAEGAGAAVAAAAAAATAAATAATAAAATSAAGAGGSTLVQSLKMPAPRAPRQRCREVECCICKESQPNIFTLCCGTPVHSSCLSTALSSASYTHCSHCGTSLSRPEFAAGISYGSRFLEG